MTGEDVDPTVLIPPRYREPSSERPPRVMSPEEIERQGRCAMALLDAAFGRKG